MEWFFLFVIATIVGILPRLIAALVVWSRSKPPKETTEATLSELPGHEEASANNTISTTRDSRPPQRFPKDNKEPNDATTVPTAANESFHVEAKTSQQQESRGGSATSTRNSSNGDTINTTTNNTNSSNSTNWRCVCETGFLPRGMLQSLGGAEAVLRMGAGQCFHKKAA